MDFFSRFWQWYWQYRAHIAVPGEDGYPALRDFPGFQSALDLIAPAWNWLMANDLIRAVVLAVPLLYLVLIVVDTILPLPETEPKQVEPKAESQPTEAKPEQGRNGEQPPKPPEPEG